MIVECPSCHNNFKIGDEEPNINRRLTCPHCQQYFEVTWLYPFTLDYPEESSQDKVLLIEGLEFT